MKITHYIKNYIKSSCPAANENNQIMMLAELLSQQNLNRPSISSINVVEWRAYSQWGEDGIIDWLVNQIPGMPEIFIEFGVGNYMESNTRMLCQKYKWRGLVIDGCEKSIASIRSQEISWQQDLTATNAFIKSNNIDSIFLNEKFSGEIGLLSIDIDGNDYWVWQSITAVDPIIVICEYNGLFGDNLPLTIPYQENFTRTSAHYSNLYFGASIRALIHAGAEKGYDFIGTNKAGNNAFFIRKDKSEHLHQIKEKIIHKPNFRESRNVQGILNYKDQQEQYSEIKNMPLISLDTNQCKLLSELENIYSEEWQENNRVIYQD